MSSATVVVVSARADLRGRAEAIAHNDGYDVLMYKDVDQLSEDSVTNLAKTEFLIVDATQIKIQNDIFGLVQVGKQFCPNSYMMVVLGGKTTPEVSVFVKKSGANAVLLENEYIGSSKLEYIWTQAVKSPFLPIKVSELRVGTSLDHDILHFMPINRKFVKVLAKGAEVSPTKFEKMKEVGEFYVHRDDLDSFMEYSSKTIDGSGVGLLNRTRLQYQKLKMTFANLVLLLSDQSEHSSFAAGKKLYDQCFQCTEDLLTNLASVDDPWDVIDNASFDAYGSLDRSSAVAAYAGLLSFKSCVGSASECMIAALMSDIGILELGPTTTLKISRGEQSKFNSEELLDYQKHPVYSLNQCLSRRVPLNENIKSIILCSHEQADGKGFPNHPRAEKIPIEAFILQFCEILDRHTVVAQGKERQKISEVRKQLFNRFFQDRSVFPISFLEQIRPEALGL